ncbi:MAG: hypothetical protein KF832_27550 [Caldilineaceae bacterium]|nr:hypothetical protein [Caldilineaceae bacterium]
MSDLSVHGPSIPLSAPRAFPTSNSDGTRTAVVAAPARIVQESALLSLQLPSGLATAGINGRYFLARCGIQGEHSRWQEWQLYRRRPLFGVQCRPTRAEVDGDQWDLYLPLTHPDPGYQWLLQQPVGQPINLMGPLGQGFTLHPQTRNLLLLTDALRAPLLFALSELMLDRGGRVTMLIRGDTDTIELITPLLSIPVEVRPAPTEAVWAEQVAELIPWADQVCIALPFAQLPTVGASLRQYRFRLETGFAQALIEGDLLCGVGACLACAVPMKGKGYTRLCIHGPVMDLLAVS